MKNTTFEFVYKENKRTFVRYSRILTIIKLRICYGKKDKVNDSEIMLF